MLPFAMLLLSAKFRTFLGWRKTILSLLTILVLVPTILALIAPTLLQPRWVRFTHKSQKYYSQLAQGCDLVLKQYPLGTNAMPVLGDGTNVVDSFRKISGHDPSLPKIIRDLGPSELFISSNHVGIMVGVRDFGINWQAQEGNTNCWTMTINTEGPESAVYSRTNN
ncbi:MAG TPA: hypothetical protein VHG71_06690 [Verrucomicrobiae bacterium]|nr:hypothetical protein [Verrucomicrobiae bacterium]